MPFPIPEKIFPGSGYHFSIIVVLNFVLFMLAAVMQSIVILSIKINIMTTDTTKKTQDMVIARRLITVVVTDVLGWFSLGLLGLLSAAGVSVSNEINVAMAIFVLPLNSALNPFLYTLNLFLEARRRAQEQKLLKLLESRITSKLPHPRSQMPRCNEDKPKPSLTIDQAVAFISNRVSSGSFTVGEFVSSLKTSGQPSGSTLPHISATSDVE